MPKPKPPTRELAVVKPDVLSNLPVPLNDRLLDIPQACAILLVSRATFYRIRSRAVDPLPTVKVGGSFRVRYGDLMAWIERNSEIATPRIA